MRYIAAASLFLFLFSCGEGENESVDTAVQDTVHCLVPYDSIGVEVGDSCYMFGSIWGRCTFPDGTIGVLDHSFGVVKFYSPEGEYLSEFAPAGGGPGEFTSIDRLGCDEHGNMMLAGFYDRKMAWYDRNLELLDEVVITSSRSGPMKAYPAPDTGYVVITQIFEEPLSAGSEVALFRGSQEPEVTYRKRLAPFDQFGDYQIKTAMVFTADQDGRVYIADESFDTFSIACCTPEGDTLYVIERPHEPVRRPQEEIDRVLELARRRWTEATGSPAGFEWEPPEFYPSIASLAVDGEGRLWVGSGNDNTLFHIFDHSGEYLHDCTLMMPRWQDPGRWAVDINPYGILASTGDPELYPIVYMLRETAGPAADQRQATP